MDLLFFCLIHNYQKNMQQLSEETLRNMSHIKHVYSPLSLENKLLIYKTILKPIWTYDIVLWGCASKSNIAIMQRYQSKILRLITNAPWYVNNQTLHTDLKIPFVHTVIQDHIRKHRNTLESQANPSLEPILH